MVKDRKERKKEKKKKRETEELRARERERERGKERRRKWRIKEWRFPDRKKFNCRVFRFEIRFFFG